MTTPKIWQRPLFKPTGSTASVRFFVFCEAPLDLSTPLSRSRHGYPKEFPFEQLDIRQHRRADSQEWFDGFFDDSMSNIALLDLGFEPAKKFALNHVYSVSVEVQDPEDLAYLMAAWAVLKWLRDRGAKVVLDGPAIVWFSAEAVQGLSPEREFSLKHEVKLVFEITPSGEFGHVFHSRGMAKFGRPDVVLLGAQPSDSTAGGALLNGLAERGALGAPLQAGQTVGPGGFEPRKLEAYLPGDMHPEVNLNNEGLVLDVAGWGLSEFEG